MARHSFLDRVAKILPPPRLHRHRYHGVFAPNAPLKPLVTERAHEDNVIAARNPSAQLLLPSPTGNRPRPKSPADPDSPPPSPPPSRWAAPLARIIEVTPLICPTCQTPLTFIAVLTDPEPIAQILTHTGEPSSPPRLHPARGPPQAELTFALGVPNADKAAQDFPPEDLDQTPDHDPAEPDPVPEDEFDQSRDA